MPTLKEITTRAKKIRKAKPRTKWQNAIKQASKELKAAYRKKEGKIGAKKKPAKVTRKKVGTTKRITGYSGYTIRGKHNVIFGIKKNDLFIYVTSSYIAARKYFNETVGRKTDSLTYQTTDIKGNIIKIQELF